MLKRLVKRSGEIEDFQNNKTNGWVSRVGYDILDRMDWSSIVIEARNTAPEQMTSQEWQLSLIKRLSVRGSQDDGYAYMLLAGRFYTIYQMKKIHGDDYGDLKSLHKKLIGKNLIRDMGYQDDELEYLNDFVINHNKNMEMNWTQVEQYNLRYSIKDYVTKQTYETPQYTNMRMAMAVYEKEAPIYRLAKVAELYHDLADDILNPPSPNYSALGTNHYGMASCCLIAATDTAESIQVAEMIGYQATKASGGLGVHLSTRAPGDPVDGGRVMHAGRLNYMGFITHSTIANKQGPRGGAVTIYDTIFSPEAELSIMTQNTRTPIEVRNRLVNIAYTTNTFFVDKAMRDEQYFTFTEWSAPDLYAAFFKGDQTEFKQLYAKYEADESFKKDYRSAKYVYALSMTQELEQSTLFWGCPQAFNIHSSFKDILRQSNLCVAPETEVLTDQGYFPISSLENQNVKVWNGSEFSETTVVRTSERSELLKVKFNNGLELDCTPYHKFYIKTGYHRAAVREVRAHELQPGMALIKCEFPVIEGERELDKAYINGFYSGDGCVAPQGQRVYLYGKKRKLRGEFTDSGKWTIQEKQDREYTHYQDLRDKYFVPLNNYSIDSRLEWFAGLCDSDGSITRNGDNQSLQIASTNGDFLRNTLLMLQTLGVSARISAAMSEGPRPMPNGRGGSEVYHCNATERLLVTSGDLRTLLDIGLNLRNHEINQHVIQRSAHHFARVVEVIETGRYDATFCFNEPKRHLGVFNGLLTGQCMEVIVPTTPWLRIEDLFDPTGHPSKGETGICNIGSIPIHRLPFNPSNPLLGMDRYKRAVRSMMNIIDYAIDNSEYRFPAIATQAKSRRNCSVGMSGVATLFAKLNLKFNTPEGLRVWHMLNERHMYACIEVALEMGIERGNAPWINGPDNDGVHGTRWVDGWLPIDTANTFVNKFVDSTLWFNWENLRGRVVGNGGIRFSSLVAHMPGEQATRKGNGSNSVYPLQGLSVDLSDGTSAMPWAALDNDLIGDQYQICFELNRLEQSVFYGVCQKFTDQAISADTWENRTDGRVLDDKYFIQAGIDRHRCGLKTGYYNRSYTEQGGKQKDIKLQEDLPVLTSKLSDELMERIASRAIEAQAAAEGQSCTLDGNCGA